MRLASEVGAAMSSTVVYGPVLLWHVLALAAALLFLVNRFDLMVDKGSAEPLAVVRHILLKDEASALEMKKAMSRLEGDALLHRCGISSKPGRSYHAG